MSQKVYNSNPLQQHITRNTNSKSKNDYSKRQTIICKFITSKVSIKNVIEKQTETAIIDETSANKNIKIKNRVCVSEREKI